MTELLAGMVWSAIYICAAALAAVMILCLAVLALIIIRLFVERRKEK